MKVGVVSERDPWYDRGAASAILTRLASPGLFASGPRLADAALGPSRRVDYTATAVTPEPGSHLTLSQNMYLQRFMQPCPPDHVTAATHRLSWIDSDGVPCTGHYRSDGLGPVVPIVARETLLALWRDLAANTALSNAVDDLSDDDFDVLAATTTDQDPIEIFRVGMEAAGRALNQHALLAHQVGIDDAGRFATAMLRSGLFGAVAGSWYWELQASTHRRGMIPIVLEAVSEDRMRYSRATVEVLAAMKQRTIAEAQQTMERALSVEGLTPAQAVRKYHTDLDLISKQYALLDPGTQPRCLALTPNSRRSESTVLADVVETFVDAFTRLLPLVEIAEKETDSAAGADATQVPDLFAPFHVPDMNCRHCKLTITAVLESHGVVIGGVDLVTKQVQAQFDSAVQRDTALAAVRDSGYTVVTGA